MKKITESQKELIALAEATIKKEQLKSLTQSAKIVLGDIILLSGTDFAKENGYCYRTNLDLVKDCELDEKTIIKSVRLLEANNVISSKRGIRGKASEYSVTPSMSSKTQSMSSEMSSKSLVEIKDYIDMKFNELRQYIDECMMKMSSKMSSEMSSKSQSMSSTDTDTESDKDIDKDSYIVNSIESITEKENKNNINNTLIMVKESEDKTIDMENNNEIINNFSFDMDENTVNEIDGIISTEIVLNESTITPNNIIGVAAVQQPQKLNNIYLSFSSDRENNNISSTNDREDNIISMGDNDNDSITSTEVQEKRDSNETSITSTIDKDEIDNDPQNLLYNNSPKKAPHFLSNETKDKDNEEFKRSIYQRLVYDPSQTNEQIEELYNDIIKLRDGNKIPQNEMDLIVYGFKDKVKYISALRDKCKL